MKAGKFVGAWISYVIVTFAMGFVWHLLVFKKIYDELAIFSRIDDPIIPLGFAAMLIQGAILGHHAGGGEIGRPYTARRRSLRPPDGRVHGQ